MKKRKKLIVIIAIILILAALFGAKAVLSAKNNFKAVNAADAMKKNLVQSISITGNIKANESEEIMLPSTQKVQEVLIKEGQEVKKGQLLIRLDASDLDNQLKKGRISLELSKRDLEKLKDEENSTAKKTMENSVKQAELSLQSTKSKYDDAQRRHEQNMKLYEAGFLSKEEFENSKSALDDLQTTMMNMELALDNAQNSLKDFDDKIYQQEKQIQITNTDLEGLQKKVADSNIKANINGTIVKMDAKNNQYPPAGSSILIYDQSQYKMDLKVSQYDAVSLKEGQRATIKIKGLDKTYEGQVTKIGESAIVEMSGTNKETKVMVEITLDNADELIKAGYEADAEIVLMEKENSIAVGFEAVQTDPEGKKYIFVLENNIVKKRIVETGLETDFEIEITTGLEEGEKYITSPPLGLQDGETVKTIGGM
ncbi:MAG: efflux RND transporter periplasmic adaptor subunit [Lutispora sp.]|nr:efflux RND transporter periplasmic adaptor subunit [Lutispora sp.]MDD4833719.1 efflux RND transporter periplasmic adaptor subunit [Lutispora sp.]